MYSNNLNEKPICCLHEIRIVLSILSLTDGKLDTGISISYLEIADATGLAQPHIPRTLNALSDKNAVRREKDPLLRKNRYFVNSSFFLS